MNARNTLFATLIIATLPAVSFADGRNHDGDDHGRRGGGPQAAQMLMSYDTDGDGNITQDEIDAFRTARLAEFDADGNGTLSLEEYQALWLDAYRERMVDNFQRHDDDGDGIVTLEEFSEDQANMVARMDRNGDGVLNADDRPERGERGGRDGRGGGDVHGRRN